MHPLHEACPPLGWYVFTAHVLQAVCAPATSWNVPVPQLGQLGVVVVVQLPLKKDPSPQLAVQLLQAVCPPATSWYVPAPQPTHVPVVVAVHEPDRRLPTPQLSVHPLHEACPPLGWYVFTAHVLQAVCAPATSWNVPDPQFKQDGVVVAVQLPVTNAPIPQLVVQVLQAVLLPATSWNVPPVQPVQTPVVVAVQLPLKNWPLVQLSVQPIQAV